MAEECRECRERVAPGSKYCCDKCKLRAKADKRWKRFGKRKDTID